MSNYDIKNEILTFLNNSYPNLPAVNTVDQQIQEANSTDLSKSIDD